MAKKHLTSFEPGDGLKVILQCVSCEGELSFSVNGGRTSRLPDRCPVCLEEWDRLERSNHRRHGEVLLGALRYFAAEPDPDSKESVRMPWTMQLVIEGGPGS